MSDQATGQVLELDRKGGRTFALRFRAYGKRRYLTLGTASEGWTRRKAEDELANVLADVRRGIWRPYEPPESALEPTFHEFASDWFDGLSHEGLAESTLAHYRLELTRRLLPFFAEHRLSEITIAEVDRYRQEKVREETLSVATLTLAGLRIGEALALRWHDVDLPAGRLRVADSKTDAGVRQVDLLPALREELSIHKAETRFSGPEDFVFPTERGRRQDRNNARRRVVVKAVERANENLTRRGRNPLPEGITPHSLRRTFISLLLATGAEVPYVMRQVGHTDPKVTLSIYAQVMYRGEGERERLKVVSEGSDWALLGTGGDFAVPEPGEQLTLDGRRIPLRCRGSVRWARLGSNQRPLACEASALPLSYAPGRDSIIRRLGCGSGGAGAVARWDGAVVGRPGLCTARFCRARPTKGKIRVESIAAPTRPAPRSRWSCGRRRRRSSLSPPPAAARSPSRRRARCAGAVAGRGGRGAAPGRRG